MIVNLQGLGSDASDCAAGDAAACTRYYAAGSAYNTSTSVKAAAAPPVAQRSSTPAAVPLSIQQIAAQLGGTVETVANLGPFGGSVTYVNVGGTRLDANLLQQRFATDNPQLAAKETADELYAQQHSGMYMSPTGPAALPDAPQTSSPSTPAPNTPAVATPGSNPAPAPSTGVWETLQTAVAPVSSATGLSNTVVLLGIAGVAAYFLFGRHQ